MGIQVDIRGHKICLCRQRAATCTHTADCPIRSCLLLYHQVSFDYEVYKPADQLPDGLVVGAGTPVEAVVVNWTPSSRVIWRHWNNHTLELIPKVRLKRRHIISSSVSRGMFSCFMLTSHELKYELFWTDDFLATLVALHFTPVSEWVIHSFGLA